MVVIDLHTDEGSTISIPELNRLDDNAVVAVVELIALIGATGSRAGIICDGGTRRRIALAGAAGPTRR